MKNEKVAKGRIIGLSGPCWAADPKGQILLSGFFIVNKLTDAYFLNLYGMGTNIENIE